jgi:hypothetical protein
MRKHVASDMDFFGMDANEGIKKILVSKVEMYKIRTWCLKIHSDLHSNAINTQECAEKK